MSCNARATNAYSDRTAVAYMCNVFFNPILKNFFESKGVRVEEDKWALSEFLQFMFRSGIRKGEKIRIYIPSLRMRNLLKRWMVGMYDDKIDPKKQEQIPIENKLEKAKALINKYNLNDTSSDA